MEDRTQLRTLVPEDQAAHVRLKSQAFERGRVVSDEDVAIRDVSKTTETTGIFENGDLQAVLTVRPFVIHWPGATNGTLNMGGIAGVATGIEARGRGHVDRLLRDSLERMRDAGQVVSALNPFAWAFYRRFGWDWVGEKRTFTVPLKEIKSSPEGKQVRRIQTEEARTLLTPLYERFGAAYRGMFVSESHQWDESFQHDKERTTYIYGYFSASGEPGGYLSWRYHSQSNDGVVREMVATTPDAYRALFSVLHYLATQCPTAKVTLPADAPLWHHVMHWELETTTRPMFMGRVVDIPAAMESLLAPAELPDGARVTFGVHDPIADWNNGTFAATVSGGRIACEASSGHADVTLDIQTFSQAFWGTPGLSELHRAGRVTVESAAGFGVLSRLLPAAPVFTMDFF